MFCGRWHRTIKTLPLCFWKRLTAALQQGKLRWKITLYNIFHENSALRLLFCVLDVAYLFFLQTSIMKHHSMDAIKSQLEINESLHFNLLMPGGNKKCFQLQVCLSMCELFVTTRHWRIKYLYQGYL